MKIKICGLNEPGNIEAIASLGPDKLGFIFYPGSKRFVGRGFVLPGIPEEIKKVGVFVNEDIREVLEIAEQYSLDSIQLHGSESNEYCRIIRSNGYEIIKAIPVKEKINQNQLLPYKGTVDCFLFDRATPGYGGSGERFEWQILKEYELGIPFLLSGGIGLRHLSDLLRFDHPQCIGVDASSRLEDRPGIKNIDKTRTLINTIRNAKIST